jgi:hypothetical protein
MEENATVPALPPPSQTGQGGTSMDGKKSKTGIILAVVGVVILLLIITAAVLLIRSDNDTTGRIRDVFIIFMALESIVIGTALVILIVQLATLINLLQNEVKPIIQSTNETVNTLRGTVVFLSDNVTEPVIKLNTYLAGLKQFLDLMRPGGKRR